MSQRTILIGLGAALASALLFASVTTGTVLGLFVLFFLSPLPIAVAGLGWGWMTGAAAAMAAAVIVPLLVGTLRGALYYALTVGAPTAFLCYLTLLSRPAAAPQNHGVEPTLEWYPIGRIVALTAPIAGALTALHLLVLGTDTDTIRASLRELIEKLVPKELLTGAEGGVSSTDLDAAASLTLLFIPVASAISFMVKFLLNLWAAGRVTRLSGRLIRPWPDLAALVLPPITAAGLAASVALMLLLPGFARLLAISFCAAFLFAYILLGLAIVHHVTRGNQYRSLILCGVYAALLLLSPWSALLVAAIGLTEPYSPLRRRWPAAPTT
jgi:hypothetical protein